MRWIRCGVVIRQMTSYTGFGQTGIHPARMALDAIQLMTTFQREESVFKSLSSTVPLRADHVVASLAIGSKSCGLMVWTGCCIVFILVAAVAFGIDDVIALV